jgi:hypothetical protein
MGRASLHSPATLGCHQRERAPRGRARLGLAGEERRGHVRAKRPASVRPTNLPALTFPSGGQGWESRLPAPRASRTVRVAGPICTPRPSPPLPALRRPRSTPPSRRVRRGRLLRGRGLGSGAPQSATVPACPARANESRPSDSPPPPQLRSARSRTRSHPARDGGGGGGSGGGL